VSVLVAGGLWIQAATFKGWPVSSSHAVVGAIAGVGWVAIDRQAVHWHTLLVISLTWVVTPLVSGGLAALIYGGIQTWILQPNDAWQRLQEWIPWLSIVLLTVFGSLIGPEIVLPMQAMVDRYNLELAEPLPLIGLGAIAVVGLIRFSWPSALDVERTVVAVQEKIEQQMARLQIVSACFVAFAHGSNDVGNAIAPLATIVVIQQTNQIPPPEMMAPVWTLLLGGLGIVAGLALWGKRVIQTIGTELVSLRPSMGFCAELATATTVLMASRLGLPVSTSHALVGGVVGVGLVQAWALKQKFQGLATLQGIFTAWILTIPISAGLSACVFLGLRSLAQALDFGR
jgi:inorganic phosphate transporter, PiT family